MSGLASVRGAGVARIGVTNGSRTSCFVVGVRLGRCDNWRNAQLSNQLFCRRGTARALRQSAQRAAVEPFLLLSLRGAGVATLPQRTSKRTCRAVAISTRAPCFRQFFFAYDHRHGSRQPFRSELHIRDPLPLPLCHRLAVLLPSSATRGVVSVPLPCHRPVARHGARY